MSEFYDKMDFTFPVLIRVDEETVYKIGSKDSISVGNAAIPHAPPPGRNPPRTPGIKCLEALFISLVCNKDYKQIGRKDGLCKTN